MEYFSKLLLILTLLKPTLECKRNYRSHRRTGNCFWLCTDYRLCLADWQGSELPPKEWIMPLEFTRRLKAGGEKFCQQYASTEGWRCSSLPMQISLAKAISLPFQLVSEWLLPPYIQFKKTKISVSKFLCLTLECLEFKAWQHEPWKFW